MRPLLRLIALVAALLPFGAQATPTGFALIPPLAQLLPGQPFSLDVVRTGEWDLPNLFDWEIRHAPGDFAAAFTVTLDGALLTTQPLAVATDRFEYSDRIYEYPAAWRIQVPGLAAGIHEMVVAYAGDGVNPAVSAAWNFSVGPVLIQPRDGFGGLPIPFPIGPGAIPVGGPVGDVTFADIDTGAIVVRPIRDLLILGPSNAMTLDLSWLTGETLVTYPGSAGYPAFSFTVQPVPTPAPAAPLALALAALAALRIRRPRLLHSPRTPGAAHTCRTPTSSTCASTPAIP